MVKTEEEMKRKETGGGSGMFYGGAGNVWKRAIGLNWDQSIRYTYSGNIGNGVEKIRSP